MIDPFESSLVRQVEDRPVISGLSSYGYDLLSPTDFRVLDTFQVQSLILSGLTWQPGACSLQTDEDGSFFIIPANSYALGVSGSDCGFPITSRSFVLENPRWRCGIIANITQAEASWEGYLTLELAMPLVWTVEYMPMKASYSFFLVRAAKQLTLIALENQTNLKL